MTKQEITFDDDTPRYFLWASVVFGVVGLLVGVIVALQLAMHEANIAPWLSFGRLRPLHTNAVIFAFVGNSIFAGIYYSTQRLLKARMASDLLSKLHFWGWQLIIVAAAITLPLGITSGKEYAELEWPIDIAIAAVWVIFGINFFWTIAKRNEKQLYVAIWFYIATVVTVAMLHIVNSLAIPVSLTNSYSIFGGVQDALVQWWYGHNAVAFFLTTPVLGIMYYFVPKAADRPVFSYRLSIVHFWALVFLYIWAGPHHLLYTALPDWAQTLGMVFSVMLWAPSWGGMINGLLTLRGAWDKVRSDPVLKFFAAAVTFYGMATFEGPLLSIKSVNGLAHYTDWIVAHVHVGALGWNGFMAAGMFYWMVPKLYGRPLASVAAANAHFYLGTFGILLYGVSMWVAGVTQGLMWREENADGGLAYTNFVETVIALMPMYWMRIVGGTLYLVGFLVMAWNLVATARGGTLARVTVEVVAPAEVPGPRWQELVTSGPMIFVYAFGAAVAFLALTSGIGSTFVAITLFAITFVAVVAYYVGRGEKKAGWHHWLEKRAVLFTGMTLIGVLIGGAAEIIPTVVASNETLETTRNVPYSPLELEGRDVYLREGCYVCHSQMIRPFIWETRRYGAASVPDDSIFDHPFQWGSKRNGPDLAREGGLRSDTWHYEHMRDPRAITDRSTMPAYAFLESARVDFSETSSKLRVMRMVGVPYTDAEIRDAARLAETQGATIAANLAREAGAEITPDSELVAMIAYLQRLGRPPARAADGGRAP